MIESINCSDCMGWCCRCSIAPMNPFDLAKILSINGEYEFHEFRKGGGFGILSINDKSLLQINEGLSPEVRIIMPCNYLNRRGLCSLHELTINEDSSLARKLINYGLPLELKPAICRHHPYYYDHENDKMMKYTDCSNTIHSIPITGKDYLISEAEFIGDVMGLLYDVWAKERVYKFVWLAQELLKTGNKDPLLELKRMTLDYNEKIFNEITGFKH